MSKSIPAVAIIGRTNVGKSSLFNQICGKRQAIVKDTPGVTRDRNYAIVKKFLTPFTLIDTGGLAGEDHSEFAQAVRTQANIAIAEADLILAIFEGIHGIHPYDSDVVDLLRRTNKPVLCVVNKCESPETAIRSAEFYGLGFDQVFPVSAAHNQGIQQLLAEINSVLKLGEAHDAEESSTSELEHAPIRVAIVGRPNVGKSTFVNKLLGEERLITSAIAGTTRDSIDTEIVRNGQNFTLIDTAGLRKKSRVEDGSVERFSNVRTLGAIARSDVAVLVLDATTGVPSDQDLQIGGRIHESGKGFIVVVNKWDAVEKDHRTVKLFKDQVREAFKFAAYAPIVFVSAVTGRRCTNVLNEVRKVYETLHQRVKTSELNNLLNTAFIRRPPPVYHGEPIKLFFATQVGVAPPTFVLFVNQTGKLNFSYERYLKNSIRKTYPFEGCDLKIVFRKRSSKEDRLAGNA